MSLLTIYKIDTWIANLASLGIDYVEKSII